MKAFQEFPKIPRLKKGMVVTEKIDGSNAQVFVVKKDEHPVGREDIFEVDSIVYEDETFAVWAGSRNRWLQPGKNTDNFGFAAWVVDNAPELIRLGAGRHYGEWYGKGIQRGYGLSDRRFALFNVGRWYSELNRRSGMYFDESGATERLPPYPPPCCDVVPVLYYGSFSLASVENCMDDLLARGSRVALFEDPEGVVVYHEAAKQYFKHLFDPTPKGAK